MKLGPAFAGLGFYLAIFLLWFVILFSAYSAFADWKRVAGEWEQYRLTEPQMNWFRSVRNKNGVPCCDISDGHPTEMERREDGIYIPNPVEKTGAWLRVPDEAMTVQKINPVGVATVWYVIQNGNTVHIRCFVPEAET